MRHNMQKKIIGLKLVLIGFCIVALLVDVAVMQQAVAQGKNSTGKVVDAKKTVQVKKETKQTKQTKKAGKNPKGVPTKEYKESDFRPKVAEESYGWMIFKTLLILGVLVGGFYYFFRYVTKKTGVQVMGEEVMQILSIVPIGQNKFLQVVDLAGKLLVLGVTDNNINVITEVTDKTEIDRIRLLASKTKVAAKESFQSIVMKHVSGFVEKVNDKVSEKRSGKKNEVAGMNESDVDLSYLRNQKNRLKKINGKDDK